MRIVAVVYDGFQLLDIAGPADVFDAANRVLGRRAYSFAVVAPGQRNAVRAGNGLTVGVAPLQELGEPIDTLLVAGSQALVEVAPDDAVVAAVASAAPCARRVASVCTGAFILAAACLLQGRRATTHWLAAERLARQHAEVDVEPDAIYVCDQNMWTSAGVTAGIDLALALVTADHGHEVARRVASGLVVYLQRPGGQSQFSTPMRAASPSVESLRELQVFIDAHPNADLSVAALAGRAGMSPRHFSRVFTSQTGLAPGRYVERSRADAARRLLETTDAAHDWVARESGLGSSETLYRVFRRRWQVAPGDYRRRFRTPAPTEMSQ